MYVYNAEQNYHCPVLGLNTVLCFFLLLVTDFYLKHHPEYSLSFSLLFLPSRREPALILTRSVLFVNRKLEPNLLSLWLDSTIFCQNDLSFIVFCHYFTELFCFLHAFRLVL